MTRLWKKLTVLSGKGYADKMPRIFPGLFMALLFPGWLTAETRQWVAVVAPELKEALRPLEAERAKEGWRVTVLTAEADIQPARRRIAELAAEPGPLCVVLVGDFSPAAGGFLVPAGKGAQLRMEGKLSDAPWNGVEGRVGREVEAGRLPARNVEELGVMVEKILKSPGSAGVFPQAALVAGHHGAPAAFSRMADALTNTLALRLISRLPVNWQLRAAVHIDGSPWQVSGTDLKTAAMEMTVSRPTLLAYMGHSAPESPISKNLSLLGVEDWRGRSSGPARAGLFFSCGCYTTELDPGRESFGFAAIRAPGGAAAVIGSHGESYAAFGYLAMCGLVNALGTDPPPGRLGQIWRGVRDGLANEEISAAEFAMLDLSDGTGGRVPLAAQRLEHLESWMLLGDPAMPLLPVSGTLLLTVKGQAEAGSDITVEGTVSPAAVPAGGIVRVTFERQPATVRPGLPEVPSSGEERLQSARRRRALSEEVVLASVAEARVDGNGKFSAVLKLPDPLPQGPWVVRAAPVKGLTAGAAVSFSGKP